jgi:hypothetical protein
MTRRVAQFMPTYAQLYVPRMGYIAGIESDDIIRVSFGAPPAASATGFLSAQSIATAGGVDIPLTAARLNAMAPFGRCLRFTASGAATSFVYVIGRDYLNQRMRERITLNGTSFVGGNKAFRFVDRIEWDATAGVTINVGWRDVFGLPFRGVQMVAETKNGAASAHAGSFAAGLAADTAPAINNSDVRGLYAPSTVVPNGFNTFEIAYIVDNTNLHGPPQFF